MLQAILAVADNGVIGHAGRLPWHHPEDRAHFRRETWGHVVIMGRRTWEEVGVALPGRTNVVVSTTLPAPRGALVVPTLEEALARAFELDPDPFVIGGARVFVAAWPRVDRVLLTRVPGRPTGDTRFEPDLRGFRRVAERVGRAGLRFLELRRA